MKKANLSNKTACRVCRPNNDESVCQQRIIGARQLIEILSGFLSGRFLVVVQDETGICASDLTGGDRHVSGIGILASATATLTKRVIIV
jgi:hypothetical protein